MLWVVRLPWLPTKAMYSIVSKLHTHFYVSLYLLNCSIKNALLCYKGQWSISYNHVSIEKADTI